MPSEQDDRDATASRFVVTLGASMAAANYPVTVSLTLPGFWLLIGTHSLWRAAIQLTGSPHRRPSHD